MNISPRVNAEVHLTEPPPGATFVMGYSSVTEDGIREGIALLAEAAG